jgi:hypothetical protein
LQDVVMTCADAATYPNAFSIGATCYYFDFTDPTSPTPQGTIYPASAAVAQPSCAACPVPTPCSCPPEVCENYLLTFSVTVKIYDNSLPNCGGVLLSTCGPSSLTVSLSQEEPGLCEWDDGFDEGVCGVFDLANPVMVLFNGAGTPPCSWGLSFQYSFSDLSPYTFEVFGNGATPDTAFFAPVTLCLQDPNGNWISIQLSIVSIVCDDFP